LVGVGAGTASSHDARGGWHDHVAFDLDCVEAGVVEVVEAGEGDDAGKKLVMNAVDESW
jgi:hypothetical protein